jgi:hypothetical protein
MTCTECRGSIYLSKDVLTVIILALEWKIYVSLGSGRRSIQDGSMKPARNLNKCENNVDLDPDGNTKCA